MSDLRWEVEWQDPLGARGPELRATWAGLSIFVDDSPITRMYDERTGSVRPHLYLPLYPLAEWIAMNWWNLVAEPRHPRFEHVSHYSRRHNLWHAREGYRLPSIEFSPMESAALIEWGNRKPKQDTGPFLESGEAFVPMPAYRDSLQRFVESVVNRLQDQGIRATPLQEEWAGIAAADPEESKFCEMAALARLNPYELSDEHVAALVQSANLVSESLLRQILPLVDIASLPEKCRLLREQIRGMQDSSSGKFANLRELRRRLRNRFPPGIAERTSPPFSMGYEVARNVREALPVKGWTSRSLDEVVRHLGGGESVAGEMAPANPQFRFFDAFVAASESTGPDFLIEKTRADSRQFAFSRALFEYLLLPEGGEHIRVVSETDTVLQQASRAFAAEFLAPAHQIEDYMRAEFQSSIVGDDEIQLLAGEFGVSTMVIQHQIANHRIGRLVA